ncbi:hypothetical protein M514_10246 [Trichuris suis]|uniref:Uncharacterized protein n=1 Tax=Trichuris suis TaxID=68888 RepID=A0A085N9S1_9BILA|nr:hypothetical protein M513_10246 [Trichuris suis]KFD66217.1 hypothetical protein M514_10246 [Trichuris suis]
MFPTLFVATFQDKLGLPGCNCNHSKGSQETERHKSPKWFNPRSYATKKISRLSEHFWFRRQRRMSRHRPVYSQVRRRAIRDCGGICLNGTRKKEINLFSFSSALRQAN